MREREIVLLEHNHNHIKDLAQRSGDAIGIANEFVSKLEEGHSVYRLHIPEIKKKLTRKVAAAIVAERGGKVTVVWDGVSGGDYICLGCDVYDRPIEEFSCGRNREIRLDEVEAEHILKK